LLPFAITPDRYTEDAAACCLFAAIYNGQFFPVKINPEKSSGQERLLVCCKK